MLQRNGRRLSGSALKVIACISMLIDHCSAIILWNYMQTAGSQDTYLKDIYNVGRAIGRIAFVLYAYLIVEGFFHTRDRRKFLLRLGAFALVSEIPFDLAFRDQIFYWKSQNVFFTLLLGVLALWAWEWLGKHTNVWCQYAAVLLCSAAAYLMKTDYTYTGVLLIFVLYCTHGAHPLWQFVSAAAVLLFGTWSADCLRYGERYSVQYLFWVSLREMYAVAAFVPISLYNGKRGRQLPKWFWYSFYPVHLLALYGVAKLLRVM
jgi:hypothetical protein